MKVISFSLWGDNPKYTMGAIKNSLLRNKFYPEWEMRVYHDSSVPSYILEELKGNNVKLVERDNQNHSNAMWRFSPASQETATLVYLKEMLLP
jgi:protein O-GlcNAc transferase